MNEVAYAGDADDPELRHQKQIGDESPQIA